MKRLFVMAMMAVVGMGWAAPGLSQVTAYRDAQENLYFDGLTPDRILQVQYSATTASASNRYQKVWVYRKSDQPCAVHQLFNTKKNFQFFNQITLKSVTPADVTFALLSIPNAGTDPAALCNGADVNLSLPWKVIAPGIRAHRAYISCFRTITNKYTGQPLCLGSNVVNIAGLSGSAYQAISPVPKRRMAKVNGCGFVKLPNSSTWQAYANDVITLRTDYDPSDERYQNYGNFTRANLPIKPFEQIPKCFDGKRFIYQP